MHTQGYCLLTAAVLSIDAFAVGLAYGVNGIKFSRMGLAVFISACLAVVSAAVFAGNILLYFSFGKRIGGFLLTGAGLVILFQQMGLIDEFPLLELIAAPEKSDFNHNRIIDCKEATVLALALSVDSSIVCAGGRAGGESLLLPVCIFLFHQLFLKAGMLLGGRIAADGCERVCNIVAGVLLLSLGLDGLIN